MSDDSNASIDDLKDLDNLSRRVSERAGSELDADDEAPDDAKGAWDRATNAGDDD